MDLEEGQLDLSVELAPIADFKPHLDTSVVIGPVVQSTSNSKQVQSTTQSQLFQNPSSTKTTYKSKNEDHKK